MGHFSSREPESLYYAVWWVIRGLQADYYLKKNTVKMSVCGQVKDWIQKISHNPLKVTIRSIPALSIDRGYTFPAFENH